MLDAAQLGTMALLETATSKRRYAASDTSFEQGHGHEDGVVVLATMPIACGTLYDRSQQHIKV